MRPLSQVFSYCPETGDVYRIKTQKIVGCPNKAGYLRVGYQYKLYYLHRLAWFLRFGVWPIKEIDHKNGNVRDNRLVNLREATRSQNGCNKSVQVNNVSGYKGVYYDNSCGGYRFNIQFTGVRYNKGTYATAIEASTARNEFAKNLHGEFSAS